MSKKYVEAFENKLSKLAKDEADAVMEAKREWAKRKGIARKRQSSADLNVSCPVLAAIAASRPSMTTRAAKDSSKGTPADPPEVRHFFVYIFLSLNYSCSVSNAPLLCVLPCACHMYSRWPALFSIFATCTAVIPAEVTCTSMSMYQVYVYTFSRALLHFSSCCTAVEWQFVCTCHDTAVSITAAVHPRYTAHGIILRPGCNNMLFKISQPHVVALEVAADIPASTHALSCCAATYSVTGETPLRHS